MLRDAQYLTNTQHNSAKDFDMACRNVWHEICRGGLIRHGIKVAVSDFVAPSPDNDTSNFLMEGVIFKFLNRFLKSLAQYLDREKSKIFIRLFLLCGIIY
jgi:hypothetical protein